VNNTLQLARPEQGVLRAAFRAPVKPFFTATHKTQRPVFKAYIDWVSSGDDPRKIPNISLPAPDRRAAPCEIVVRVGAAGGPTPPMGQSTAMSRRP